MRKREPGLTHGLLGEVRGLVAGTLLIQGGEVVIDDLEHDLVELLLPLKVHHASLGCRGCRLNWTESIYNSKEGRRNP